MPTTVHESFRSGVVLEIQEHLDRISNGVGEAAEFARLVRYHGSPKLHFAIDDNGGDSGSEAAASQNKKKQFDPHEPDAVFRHSAVHWPGVIIEVSFSQKRKMLKDLAEDYIFGSNGSVRVVVGLDIEYRQSKMATLSVWRLQLIKGDDGQRELVCAQIVTDQVFRDAAGNPICSATGLELLRRDFAPSTFLSADAAGDQCSRIAIPSRTLSDFVT
jgi:hypothetical protein